MLHRLDLNCLCLLNHFTTIVLLLLPSDFPELDALVQSMDNVGQQPHVGSLLSDSCLSNYDAQPDNSGEEGVPTGVETGPASMMGVPASMMGVPAGTQVIMQEVPDGTTEENELMKIRLQYRANKQGGGGATPPPCPISGKIFLSIY